MGGRKKEKRRPKPEKWTHLKNETKPINGLLKEIDHRVTDFKIYRTAFFEISRKMQTQRKPQQNQLPSRK